MQISSFLQIDQNIFSHTHAVVDERKKSKSNIYWFISTAYYDCVRQKWNIVRLN